MANTSLPESISGGQGGHLGHSQIVHTELNRMTRDSGSVDITSLLRNGWTSDRVLYRRRDQLVEFKFQGLNGMSATSTTVLSFSDSNGVPEALLPHTNDLPFNTGLYLNASDRADPCFFTFQGTALQCRLASNGAASGVVSVGSSSFIVSYMTGRGWYGALPTG